jgi:nucleoid-associated protein YgaU
VSAPISVPAPPSPPRSSTGGGAQVESYDENTYTSKPNDTFKTISQELYHTDQYEQALSLFNRNHPLATAALQRDPTVLQPGQPIYIPPARILEKYYGAPAVDAVSPPSTPTPTRTFSPPDNPNALRPASAVSSPLPPTSGENRMRVDPVPSVSPQPSRGGASLYRVREGGEMMREIAVRTLGSGDRWMDIWRLNRNFDPKDAVPGGTPLRLPPDARINPQDAF